MHDFADGFAIPMGLRFIQDRDINGDYTGWAGVGGWVCDRNKGTIEIKAGG
jgi:hypothetical protein